MSRYIVKLSNITSSQGAGEYDGGHTLEKARREANFFAMHSPGARITINTATRDGRLKLVEVYHEPRSEGLRRDTKHRSRTRTEYVASLGWNIRDAEEALHNAITMRDWRGVEKYVAQIRKLEAEKFRAEAHSPRELERSFIGRYHGRQRRRG
jgi:hypothetical protein